MAERNSTLVVAITNFFLRNGLPPHQARNDCHAVLKLHFPGKRQVEPVPSQGFCSYTVLVGSSTIVQFRPQPFALDMQLTTAARDVYGNYAPTTRVLAVIHDLGLVAYAMSRVPGMCLREYRLVESALHHDPTDAFRCRRRSCEDFAVFLALGWRRSHLVEYIARGKVGSSLEQRVKMLSTQLPSRFQAVAQVIQQNLGLILQLPWVLSHGDLAAGNIMLNPSSGHLTGFVDWAEAEVLPFGICLYGLEELLGEMTPNDGFIYHSQANALREAFWCKLKQEIPELDADPQLVYSVSLARHLGVLLWHGFAWDDGSINRVVEEGREADATEIRYLDAFLPSALPLSPLRSVL